ncbi:M28 family metallopeptidase [uncultured Microbacterium sp.]|uniref:M28 family metallopeptidase n=1 Tax=uncultured Microbacterium sp. TaxID=191216 RepID=UPI0028D274F3|nr:M28 family metallopeptidase [uncultured Microbacterium sp.]
MAVASGAVAALALATLPATGAFAAPPAAQCDNRNNNTVAKLLDCVTPDGVMEHLKAFQAIADANDGNRAATTSGYDASVEYVIDVMRDAGWTVTEDTFDFEQQAAPTVQQLTPVDATLETAFVTGSPVGDITAAVTAIDYGSGTSGCEAGDFTGFAAGTIALIQRGGCTFAVKAANADAAGAAAIIIANNVPGLLNPTLGEYVATAPVAFTTPEGGASLSQSGSTARVFVPDPVVVPQRNVIAELPGRNNDNVVMAGAHLDSVPEGPGINDNGSGSAALLEVAQNLSKLKPENTIRFAWWAAEEEGLVGSTSYVDRLPQEERDRIALYLNFDMIASPNYMFMIYDSDESGYPAPVEVPEGSVQIEDLFESYFTSVNEPYTDAEFSGRSDYAAFIDAGIASGGLFTGAEEVKTPEQAAIWGGTAGQWLDPCYHQGCDTILNISEKALGVNSDAIALAVLAYSYSTETVNGVVGKSIPGGLALPAPAGPVAEGSAGAGGGLHQGAAE